MIKPVTTTRNSTSRSACKTTTLRPGVPQIKGGVLAKDHSSKRPPLLRMQSGGPKISRKYDMVAWAPATEAKQHHYCRPATISLMIVLLFVGYIAALLLWYPELAAFLFKAEQQLQRSSSSQLHDDHGGTGARSWGVHDQSDLSFADGNRHDHDRDQLPPPELVIPDPVQKLLSDIKQATRTAVESGGSPIMYNKAEQEKWRRQNPCRARFELPLLYSRSGRKGSRNVGRNYMWEVVLEEYATLHRTCMRKIRNLGTYFSEESTIPGCQFVTGESLFGLGNKITYAASVVLYGILTQRVVLFYEWKSWIPAVMCEPFDGSTWKLPPSLQHLNSRKQKRQKINEEAVTNITAAFLGWIDQQVADRGGTINIHRESSSSTSHRSPIYYTEMDDGWQPVDRFFCDSEQQFLADVRWISMAGCLYFMPKLFAVPLFRATLEALFPDRLALTHVLRSVFLPYNVAWDRIKRHDDMFLRQADKRVSVQVRYRHGTYEHSKLRSPVNEHTIRCLLENKILPNISTSRVHDARNPKYVSSLESQPSTTKVLITSLYTDLYELLHDMYLRHPTLTGESVGFVQLTHEYNQHWGYESDTQALVEIILLSFADEMLVTPLSTFGGVAQAYGGLKPWIVEHDEENSGSCVRASSVDLCYQQASDTMSCPNNPDVHHKKVYELVPYLKQCLDVDSPSGLVLITDF